MSLLKEGIKEEHSESVILFELQTDTVEMFIISTDPDAEWNNDFVLIWGDYVANVWEEKFSHLSQATARMAQLMYVCEQDAEGETVMFEKHGDEFVSAWDNFLKETTSAIKYEGAK